LPSRKFLTIILVVVVTVLHMFILLVNEIVDFRIPSTLQRVLFWSFLFVRMAAIAVLSQPVTQRGWKSGRGGELISWSQATTQLRIYDTEQRNSEFRRNLTKIPLFQTALDWLGVKGVKKMVEIPSICICPEVSKLRENRRRTSTKKRWVKWFDPAVYGWCHLSWLKSRSIKCFFWLVCNRSRCHWCLFWGITCF